MTSNTFVSLEDIPRIKTNKCCIIASIFVDGKTERFESHQFDNPKRELSVDDMLGYLPLGVQKRIGDRRPPELFIKLTTDILIRCGNGKLCINEPA